MFLGGRLACHESIIKQDEDRSVALPALRLSHVFIVGQNANGDCLLT
jgi:hypothetical protein